MAEAVGAPAAGSANIALALSAMAQARPDAVAMHWPAGRAFGRFGRTRWASVSYAELEARSNHAALGLRAIGLAPGSRAVLMVKPGIEFFVCMYGLFKAGIVPVLIDPGIDRRALRQCLDEARPQAFVGIPLAHCARLLLGWARASVRQRVTVGRRLGWGGHTLRQVEALGAAALIAGAEPLHPSAPDDLAAILFTSGSTGVPKGVEYRHRMFAAQVELLREAFAITPGAVNLPTFPPFALFDPALGLTSVIPDMDARHPARADPRRIIEAIERFGCSMMFGSPALLRVLVAHARQHGVRLAGLQRLISAGAPVAPALVEQALALLPASASIWTPYGATEALPVAIVEGRELLGATRVATEQGAGICIGRPPPHNRVRIIAIGDDPIPHWHDGLELPPGAIGEICVRGPSVTEHYHGRPLADALAKIVDVDGAIVHRMGDLGRFDEQGRLWFVGRKSQRVEGQGRSWYTECAEQVFNSDPDVARAALVGLGSRPQQQPLVWIERRPGSRTPWLQLLARLQALAPRYPATTGLERFLPHPGFPVDIRHNAKIGREQLAAEAERRLGAPSLRP